MKLSLKISICFLILFVCLYKETLAQDYEIEHITSEQGLPDNRLMCLYKDTYGFVWIGTKTGLSRYDGHNFRNYVLNPEAEKNIDKYVLFFLEKGMDSLFIASYGSGVWVYNQRTEQFSKFEKIKEKGVCNMYFDSSGNLWILTAGFGVAVYDRNYNKINQFDKSNQAIYSNAFRAICEYKKNDIWLGSQLGLYRIDISKKTSVIKIYLNRIVDTTSLSQDWIESIYKSEDNSLWIGTGEGVNRYLPTTDNFERITFPEKKIFFPTISIASLKMRVKCILVPIPD